MTAGPAATTPGRHGRALTSGPPAQKTGPCLLSHERALETGMAPKKIETRVDSGRSAQGSKPRLIRAGQVLSLRAP